MKQLQFGQIVRRFLATAVTLTMLAIAALNSAPRVHAIEASKLNTQTAEILALLSAVHEVTSYNGDPAIKAAHLAAWRELWAEDATFIINNAVTFTGREAIMGFFAGAAFFNNNWIGLSPSFRTQVEVNGNTAEVYLECIFLNQAKAVVAERSLNGTVRKVNGNWRFWRMHNDPAQPLF